MLLLRKGIVPLRKIGCKYRKNLPEIQNIHVKYSVISGRSPCLLCIVCNFIVSRNEEVLLLDAVEIAKQSHLAAHSLTRSKLSVDPEIALVKE